MEENIQKDDLMKAISDYYHAFRAVVGYLPTTPSVENIAKTMDLSRQARETRETLFRIAGMGNG